MTPDTGSGFSTGGQSEDKPTRRALLQKATRQLQAAGRQAPRQTAEWLLMDVLACDRARLHTRSGEGVEPDAAQKYMALVERRIDGEPLQHILGYTSFRGLRIDVSPEVMIPRPETEEVVETALRALEGTTAPRVLDVGTGSGCIALAIKHERPDATVCACDVSPAALRMAQANADRLELDIRFADADLFADASLNKLPDQLALLVSNPPYIPEEEADTLPAVVREYDPGRALFTRGDPLRYYRRLATVGETLCRSGGALVLETHTDYATDVADLLRGGGFEGVRVEEDLSGRPRIVRGRLA